MHTCICHTCTMHPRTVIADCTLQRRRLIETIDRQLTLSFIHSSSDSQQLTDGLKVSGWE